MAYDDWMFHWTQSLAFRYVVMTLGILLSMQGSVPFPSAVHLARIAVSQKPPFMKP